MNRSFALLFCRSGNCHFCQKKKIPRKTQRRICDENILIHFRVWLKNIKQASKEKIGSLLMWKCTWWARKPSSSFFGRTLKQNCFFILCEDCSDFFVTLLCRLGKTAVAGKRRPLCETKLMLCIKFDAPSSSFFVPMAPFTCLVVHIGSHRIQLEIKPYNAKVGYDVINSFWKQTNVTAG